MPAKPKRKANPARRRVLRLALIIAILVLLATMGIYSYLVPVTVITTTDDPTFSPATLLDVRRLTDLPADEKEPIWSPEGSQIAFVGHTDGNPDVYTVDVETGEVAQITTNPNDDHRPQWTSTTTLTYQQRPDDRPFAYDRTTGTTIPLASPPSIWPWRWDWPSNNGEWTFARHYLHQSGSETAVLLNRNTREVQPIFNNRNQPQQGYFVGGATWSPDDAYVAFIYREQLSENEHTHHVYTYHLPTDALNRVDSWGGPYHSINHVLWLNETTLLYNDDTYGEQPAHNLQSYKVTTGDRTTISAGASSLSRLLVSPHHNPTLYAELRSNACASGCREIRFYNAVLSHIATRTLNHDIRGVAFIPNRPTDLLAFHTYAGLYMINPLTGDWDNVIYGRHISHINLSPSGRYIVAQATNPPDVDPLRETLIFDTRTRALWTTGTRQPWLGAVAWSPDETRFAFSSGGWGEQDLYIATLP